MQFLKTLLLAASALASVAAAENSIHFINQDATVSKNIKFTANKGLQPVDPIVIAPGQNYVQTFPDEWIGNFYSYDVGAKDVPGMLGEVRFGGYGGDTYYDVSSIVNPGDTDGVKILYPAGTFNGRNSHSIKLEELANSPHVSGCQTTDCTKQYNKWDDIATLSTPGNTLVCLVGSMDTTTRRRSATRFSRDFVTS